MREKLVQGHCCKSVQAYFSQVQLGRCQFSHQSLGGCSYWRLGNSSWCHRMFEQSRFGHSRFWLGSIGHGWIRNSRLRNGGVVRGRVGDSTFGCSRFGHSVGDSLVGCKHSRGVRSRVRSVCPVQCVTVVGLCAVCFVAKCSTVVSIT